MFYGTCMDTTRAIADGAGPRLRGPRDGRASMAVGTIPGLAAPRSRALHRIGTTSIFTFTSAQDAKHSADVIADASQGGIGLPEARLSTFVRTRPSAPRFAGSMSGTSRGWLALTGEDSTRAARASMARADHAASRPRLPVRR